MNPTELKELAVTLIGIADGKPWQINPDFVASPWRDHQIDSPVKALELGYKIRLKPWELGRTVNGHTLPDGASWHRKDFTEDMLSAPYRPMMLGEIDHSIDEIDRNNGKGFVPLSDENDFHCPSEGFTCHTRTTRPIPFALTPEQIADGWLPWAGGECPVEPESVPWYIIRKDGVISNDSAACRLEWEHRGSISDIIAYRPDPYGKFRQALADGRVIQCKDSYYKWVDLERPVFDSPPDQYRVKPEPQWLPLGKMDIHPGSILRKSDWPEGTWEAVLGTENGGIQWREGYESFDSLNLDWLINRPRHRDADGNPTLWEPCRKPSAV